MNALEILGIVASVASVAFLALAAFVLHRDSLRRTREEGNIAVSKERIKGIANGLNATAVYLQQLIRQADDPDTPVRELQNMARGVRAGLLGVFMDAKEMTSTLDRWKVGEPFESGPVRVLDEQGGGEVSDVTRDEAK